ncbi:MAG: hypothetical protein ACRD16_05390 [Thermoanaerobaculia bacterium]
MITDIDTCPKCGSEELYRSRTRTRFERVARLLLPVHYYRCLGCGWRRSLATAEGWRDWRSRISRRVLPVLLGVLLVSGFLYLGFEGSRQVLRTRTPAAHSGKKR